jgi:aldose 1-epimerase
MVKKDFRDSSGQTETRYTLVLASGAKVVLSSFGAILVSALTPDNYGEVKDVVLGFDTREEYASKENPWFGATCGRTCNRIKGGKFEMEGKTIQLETNGGKNHLHGGV